MWRLPDARSIITDSGHQWEVLPDSIRSPHMYLVTIKRSKRDEAELREQFDNHTDSLEDLICEGMYQNSEGSLQLNARASETQ